MEDNGYRGPRIVVIGGGTGSFTLLTGLKQYARDVTALVNMADDGGSTGVLRDELGVLPPGDVRQCLVALSDSPTVRELFNYRFDVKQFTSKHYVAKGLPLVAKTVWQGNGPGDSIAKVRTFIRHDADRVARELMRIYFA